MVDTLYGLVAHEGINPQRAEMLARPAEVDETDTRPVVFKLSVSPEPQITGANLEPVGNPSDPVIRRAVDGVLPPLSMERQREREMSKKAVAYHHPAEALAPPNRQASVPLKRPPSMAPLPENPKKKKAKKQNKVNQANQLLFTPVPKLDIPNLGPPPPEDCHTKYLQSLLESRPFRLDFQAYGRDRSLGRDQKLELQSSVAGLLQLKMIAKMKDIPILNIPQTMAQILDPGFVFSQSIKGVILEDIWSGLSLEKKRKYCRQLRFILTRMHQPGFTGPSGPLGSAISGMYRLLLDKHADHTYYAIRERGEKAQFVAFLLSSMYDSVPKAVLNSLATRFSPTHKLVLAHGHISPKNIIVREEVIVAITGWDFSGWYPCWWDYVKFFEARTRDENEDWYDFAGEIFERSFPMELAAYQGVVRCQRR